MIEDEKQKQLTQFANQLHPVNITSILKAVGNGGWHHLIPPEFKENQKNRNLVTIILSAVYATKLALQEGQND